MKLARVTDVADRLIKNLSKGYRQRVGIAQALVGNPEVLVLDEPTVGLDPKQIIEIRNLIKDLGKKHTVILSSHILTEVKAVCDRIVIINQGTIAAIDTPEGLSRQMGRANKLSMTPRAPPVRSSSNCASSRVCVQSPSWQKRQAISRCTRLNSNQKPKRANRSF